MQKCADWVDIVGSVADENAEGTGGELEKGHKDLSFEVILRWYFNLQPEV